MWKKGLGRCDSVKNVEMGDGPGSSRWVDIVTRVLLRRGRGSQGRGAASAGSGEGAGPGPVCG